MTYTACKISTLGRGLAGAAVALALSAPVAFAQQPATPAAPAAPAATAKPATTIQPEWLKVCGKDEDGKTEVCSTTSYITADAGNVVGEVRVFEAKREKETRRIFEALIPPGFLIQPGVNLVIDDPKAPTAGRYRICFPNACLTEVQMNDELLNKMKKGNQLTFFAANAQGQWVPAKVSLSGFTKVFEGAPLDPKEYEARREKFQESQKQLQQQLVQRAEEQRKKLQEQGKAGAAPAAPAEAPAGATKAP